MYVSLVLLIATGSSATAQSGPTPQEQMACRSDASAFCAEHIGKPPQMNACLRENKAKLTTSCRKVVEAAAAEPASMASRISWAKPMRDASAALSRQLQAETR
jgi:hypothetical protein